MSEAVASAIPQSDTTRFSVWFEQGVTEIDPGYRSNNESIAGLQTLLDAETVQVHSIELNIYSSPDETIDNNLEIGAARLAGLRSTIFSSVDPEKITDINNTIDVSWMQILEMLEQNHPATQKFTALEFIKYYIQKAINRSSKDGSPVNTSSIRNSLLNEYRDGIAWKEVCQLFPDFRRVDVTIVSVPVEIQLAVAPVEPEQIEPEPEAVKRKRSKRTTDPDETVRGLCRIKTNLIYDAVAVANLSIEAGFAKHWAFEVLATFSPWDLRANHKIRTLLFQSEFKFYPGKNFRGHYVGLEGHYGWYNIYLPFLSSRYQDKDGNTPLWGAGLVYGYVVPFGKHCGMDFSIGAGYTRFEYDRFYNIENGAKFTSSSKDLWGPTKAGVTFFIKF